MLNLRGFFGAPKMNFKKSSRTLSRFSDERKVFDYVVHSVSLEDELQLYGPPSGQRRAFRNESHGIFDALDPEGIKTLLFHGNEDIPGPELYSNSI